MDSKEIKARQGQTILNPLACGHCGKGFIFTLSTIKTRFGTHTAVHYVKGANKGMIGTGGKMYCNRDCYSKGVTA